MDILQYLWKITVYFVYFFYQIDELRNVFGSRIRICGEIYVTAEHAFISSEYLHVATDCNFRVHFPWVRSNIVSLHHTASFTIKLNYKHWLHKLFLHREMNLKSDPHTFLWKPSAFIKCSVRFFIDSLL